MSDLNSACLKVLVPVKIFQIQDMLNESEQYLDATTAYTHWFNESQLGFLNFDHASSNEKSITKSQFMYINGRSEIVQTFLPNSIGLN